MTTLGQKKSVVQPSSNSVAYLSGSAQSRRLKSENSFTNYSNERFEEETKVNPNICSVVTERLEMNSEKRQQQLNSDQIVSESIIKSSQSKMSSEIEYEGDQFVERVPSAEHISYELNPKIEVLQTPTDSPSQQPKSNNSSRN